MEDKYKSVFTSLQSTIRASFGVAAQDIPFYRKLDKPLDQSVSKSSSKLLDLANTIMQHVAKGEVDELVPEDPADDLKDSWGEVNTALDSLTYKIDNCLTAHRKELKKDAQADGDNTNESGSKQDGAHDFVKLTDNGRTSANNTGEVNRHQFDLPKPQLKFKIHPDNSKDKPFKPRLISKPNAVVSFEESVKLVAPTEDSNLEQPYYLQPYEREIMNSPYPKSVYTKHEPTPSLSWTETKPIWVDTVEKLNKMIEQISNAPEIAIDLEHHDYRSYLGFTCLMQLSDRKSDFIIDTLALRDDLQPLNKIFTDPNVVKVLHGSSMDIIWLQRDLGLYIVSLFDTFHASKRLGLKRNGLAYLLETYANFQTSKKYQLADWRVRPISPEMLSYAQSDTHFLLNIYDKIKNQLIDQNVLPEVLENSRKTASQRFEMPGYETNPEISTYNESIDNLSFKNNLDKKQRVFLEHLYEWRDKVSRQLDESPSFIMPIHTLISLCTSMPLKAAEIIQRSGPHGARLREHSKELQKVMQEAKKAADSLAVSNEATEESNPDNEPQTLALEYDNILDNYSAYEKSFQKALSSQSTLFDSESIENVTKSLQKPVSKFWGVTLLNIHSDPEAAALLFPIEHIPEGIALYSGSYERYSLPDNRSSETKPEETINDEKQDKEKSTLSDGSDLVFIGQSGATGSIPSTMDAIKKQDKNSSTSADTIMMPTESELLGSNIKLLTKNERKKLKREKRRLEQEQSGAGEGNEYNSDNASESKKSKKEKKKSKKRSKSGTDSEEDGNDSSNPVVLSDSDTEYSPSIKKQKTTDDEEDQPKLFDYESAPSVLNSEGNTGKKSGKGKKNKVFDPYRVLDNANLTGATKKHIATNIHGNSSISFKVSKQSKKKK